MRTDRETRELQAIWKFLYDLAEAMRVAQSYKGVAGAEAEESLKKHIKDTAAAYGTNIA